MYQLLPAVRMKLLLSEMSGIRGDGSFDAGCFSYGCQQNIVVLFLIQVYVECRPELEKRKKDRADLDARRQEANLARLQKDLAESKGQNVVLSAPRRMEEEEEENEDDEDAYGEEDHNEVFHEIGGRLQPQ